jgi:cytochrome b involved in lipid metabolism
MPPLLASLVVEVRMRDFWPFCGVDETNNGILEVDKLRLRPRIAQQLENSIITLEDVFSVEVGDTSNEGTVRLGCIVSELVPVEIADDHSENAEESPLFAMDDNYRGQMTRNTTIILRNCDQYNRFKFVSSAGELNCSQVENLPPQRTRSDVVHIFTSDEEVFPVTRQLLRPCIALTSIVQEGRGKYRSTTAAANDSIDAENVETTAVVDVSACTFDRVLLYLEHEARGEQFKFDPLLAAELRSAAAKLTFSGLMDLCDEVLGSFTERVRRKSFRYSEIVEINSRGWDFSGQSIVSSEATEREQSADLGGMAYANSKRVTPIKKTGETILILNGMVLDITRWLDEHPGGSKIIPTVALNVDSAIFFEIYHASTQSYLYLKEFYIGELAKDEYCLVPFSEYYNGEECSVYGTSATKPSAAFLEQLGKVTQWRLKPEDLIRDENVVHKSF